MPVKMLPSDKIAINQLKLIKMKPALIQEIMAVGKTSVYKAINQCSKGDLTETKHKRSRKCTPQIVNKVLEYFFLHP